MEAALLQPHYVIQKSEIQNDADLSNFLRELKKSTNEITTLRWSVLKVVSEYSNIPKWCIPCACEKLLIANYLDQKYMTNKRSK